MDCGKCHEPQRPCVTSKSHLPQVAERCGVHVSEVKNVIIWGNHSSTQYPDVNHGSVSGKPIRQAIGDDAWLDGEFISIVQQRGAAIIKARSKLFHAVITCNACIHTIYCLFYTMIVSMCCFYQYLKSLRKSTRVYNIVLIFHIPWM